MPVNVIDRIVPKNNGAFPVVSDEHFLGGFRVVADATARDAIPSQRRTLGMWVSTRSDGKTWTLQGGLLNTDWVEVAFGGGGGTTIYATELLLKAASPTPGTIGYAQDTGSFWFRRAATWQTIPHPSVVRRVESPYTITVDPVAGDDADWNDGTATPLKTIEACFKRLPEAIQSTLYSDPPQAVKVLLKAGAHAISAGSSPYEPLTVDFGAVRFEGELSTPFSSFNIDHYSGDDMVVWQPAGNPAWVPDEHVGRVVEVLYVVGGDSYPFQYFIIANGTHDLTVAFDGAGYSAYFPVGTPSTIKELATKWVGPRPVLPSGKQDGWSSGFFFIDFDASALSSNRFFDQYQGSIGFNTCLLRGSGNTPYTHNFLYVEYGSSSSVFLNSCMYLNQFGAIDQRGGNVFMYRVTAANCSRIIECEGPGVFTLTGGLVTRNSVEIFRAGNDIRARWNYAGVIYCLNTSAIWSFAWAGDATTLHASGRDIVVADGKLPDVWFILGPNTLVEVSTWSTEGLVPARTFYINGVYGYFIPGVIPDMQFSYADLVNLYDGDLDFGWGTRIIATAV